MRQITPDEIDEIDVPLSAGMAHEDFVFVSGQIPQDLATGEIIGDDIETQTEQTLDNVEAVLEEADASMDDVIKTTVFLTDVEEFPGMNEAYSEAFSEPYPARSAFEVGDLAADILVEIEAIAIK
jgi:2-iminobutanoate/2-iminopropanoate deaminase